MVADGPRTGRARPQSGQTLLLSGGNPQIAKGEGEAPVHAYLAAMPGWKQAIGRQLDELVTRTVPGLRKAVKWNSPFYGVDGRGWFLSFHCFDRYVKVAFFRGAALDPPPPVGSRHQQVRYLHVGEDGIGDPEQFCAWVHQASLMDGERF